MVSIVGIDSRSFVRNVRKTNGSEGHFESVIGVAIKIRDYIKFKQCYLDAIKKFNKLLKCENDLQFYCYNDIKKCETTYEFLESFFREISQHIEKAHVFYTLFSKKRLSKVKVYGRMAQRKKIKLGEPTRTYEKLLSGHILQCFPAICAWRLTEHLHPRTVEFHLDAYNGHIFEAQEQLDKLDFEVSIYPGGDCVNPVISTADLLIELLDKRLEKNSKFLLFENIRPALPELGDKVLVYPILNKHLPYITPLDKKTIDIGSKIRHPIFWVFKGEDIVDSGTIKRSKSYRNLQDYVSNLFGVVKMFDKSKDIEYFQEGDSGVYLNSRGKEQIESYIKVGKKFKLFSFDNLVPNNLKK
ncbi:MAG: hypothetical protein KAK00_03605 [Nanoarchaeota archaeon]|nr:hypothetical protein [Nanoarchaeota archaeon]